MLDASLWDYMWFIATFILCFYTYVVICIKTQYFIVPNNLYFDRLLGTIKYMGFSNLHVSTSRSGDPRFYYICR